MVWKLESYMKGFIPRVQQHPTPLIMEYNAYHPKKNISIFFFILFLRDNRNCFICDLVEHLFSHNFMDDL